MKRAVSIFVLFTIIISAGYLQAADRDHSVFQPGARHVDWMILTPNTVFTYRGMDGHAVPHMGEMLWLGGTINDICVQVSSPPIYSLGPANGTANTITLFTQFCTVEAERFMRDSMIWFDDKDSKHRLSGQ